jgi:hypothetical protein
VSVGVGEQTGDAESRRQPERSQVADRRMLEDEAGQPLAHARAIVERPFEHEAAARDQVIADVMTPVVCRIALQRLASHGDRARGDDELGRLRTARQLFDRVAVAIARREVHLRVCPGRIPAEHLLDHADAVEEQRPVDRRQQPHAGDDVADGELVAGFALMFDAHQRFRRIPLRLERAPQRLPRARR